MTKKLLVPIPRLNEEMDNDLNEMRLDNPVKQRRPLSIETALIYGEQDRFYNIIDSKKEFTQEDIENIEQNNVVGLNVINVQFDDDPCSMILFRNWTSNFKYQFEKSQKQS